MKKAIDTIITNDFKFNEEALIKKNKLKTMLAGPNYKTLLQRIEREDLLRALVVYGLNTQGGINTVRLAILELIDIKKGLLENPNSYQANVGKYNALVNKVKKEYAIEVNFNGESALRYVCETSVPLTHVVLEHVGAMLRVTKALSEPTDFVFMECATVLKKCEEILLQIEGLLKKNLDGCSEVAVKYAQEIVQCLETWSNVRVTTMLNSAHKENGKARWNGTEQALTGILEQAKRVAEQWSGDVNGIMKRKYGKVTEVRSFDDVCYQVLAFAR